MATKTELGEFEFENLLQLFKALKNKSLPYGMLNGVSAETNGKISSGSDLIDSINDSDVLRQSLALAFARWDQSEPSEKFRFSSPFSEARREIVYQLLSIPEEYWQTFSKILIVANSNPNESEIVLADWEPWFEERKIRSSFYWDAYESALINHRSWDSKAVGALDLSTSRVVARLANPTSDQAYQSKGLVVGHVQSGKTAHFTGVIAKAIDSGYRLVIVLAGMHNILRNQTQRRLDMELVGRQNIVRGRDENVATQRKLIDYARSSDLDWSAGKFIVHSVDPWKDPEVPKIIRLTSSDSDYRKLGQGIGEIEFNPAWPEKPLYDATNLKRENVRLVVIKKNKAKLESFIEDLKAQWAGLENVPALIVDDEADQASINTINPRRQSAADRADRTAINRLITNMLGLMPRAQYLAYTATPFANVFVDAEDAADLFPRDFIFGLETPRGYMGGSDFHDFEELPDGEEANIANRNELAFVRNIRSQSEEDLDLSTRDAIDAFVLSGAIKLWRRSNNPGAPDYRHHTMLFHESVRVAEHDLVAERVRNIWHSAGPESTKGLDRLEELFLQDFGPVSAARSEAQPFPSKFAELIDFIGDARQKIAPHGDPVVVVNGARDDEYNKVDFDSGPFWRILVGGTKLSRGFTVEGLTVSFYRRSAGQEDTLMQMGRWFGYRHGYKDLIRLYIDRNREVGSNKSDLYAAFGAIVQGEQKFREQLSKYSVLGDDEKPLVQPFQVPPLVWQSAELSPTARNKMFNASIVSEGQGGVVKQLGRPQLPGKNRNAHRDNFELVRPWLDGQDLKMVRIGSYQAELCVRPASEMLNVIEKFHWHSPAAIEPTIEYIRTIVRDGRFSDVVVVLPRLRSDKELVIGGKHLRVSKKYRRSDRPEFTLPNETDRTVLRILSGAVVPEGFGADVMSLPRPRRGALMVTLALEGGLDGRMETADISELATILTFATPYEEGKKPEVAWSYKNQRLMTSVVVDAESSSQSDQQEPPNNRTVAV